MDNWSAGSGSAKPTPLGQYQWIVAAAVLAVAVLGAAFILKSGGSTPPTPPAAVGPSAASPAAAASPAPADSPTPLAGLSECQNAADAAYRLWGKAMKTGRADTSSVDGLVADCYAFQGSYDHQVQACQDSVDLSLQGTQLSTEWAAYLSSGFYEEAKTSQDEASQLLIEIDRPWRECWA